MTTLDRALGVVLEELRIAHQAKAIVTAQLLEAKERIHELEQQIEQLKQKTE